METHNFRIASGKLPEMVRKLCLLDSFGRTAGNCFFPQNFHSRKLCEITAFYAVIIDVGQDPKYKFTMRDNICKFALRSESKFAYFISQCEFEIAKGTNNRWLYTVLKDLINRTVWSHFWDI